MAYLDYNATTPLAAEALEAMMSVLKGRHGNPSSIHSEGRSARAVVDAAREDLADLLGVKPHEIVFTSGGTEACNLGVLGIARAAARAGCGRHVITSPTEHHAVLHAIRHLCEREQFEVTMLPVDSDGRVFPQAVASALREDTVLVSLMHANNETGVVQPVGEIAQLCRGAGVCFVSDAVQSFGKLPVLPEVLGADAIAFAAHKFYGPKGAGFLWLRAGVEIDPLVLGGSHENSRRPGTENVAAIAGMAAAARVAESIREFEAARLLPLREELWSRIRAIAPGAIRNGGPADTLSNTLNVSFPQTDGEALLIGLDIEGISVSSGSACMVGSMQASHVILAMGRDPATASSTVRFSLGRGSSHADLPSVCSALETVLARSATLRSAA